MKFSTHPWRSILGGLTGVLLATAAYAAAPHEAPMRDFATGTVADWIIRRRLLAIRGVSQVIPIGGEVKQYQVLTDPARMLATRVTLEEVLRAASEYFRTSPRPR